jgi:hypothetical protein
VEENTDTIDHTAWSIVPEADAPKPTFKEEFKHKGLRKVLHDMKPGTVMLVPFASKEEMERTRVSIRAAAKKVNANIKTYVSSEDALMLCVKRLASTIDKEE